MIQSAEMKETRPIYSPGLAERTTQTLREFCSRPAQIRVMRHYLLLLMLMFALLVTSCAAERGREAPKKPPARSFRTRPGKQNGRNTRELRLHIFIESLTFQPAPR